MRFTAERRRRQIGSALLVVGLLTTAASAQPEPQKAVVELPNVPGFMRRAPKVFPNPKHGYIVTYEGPKDLFVNVHVYNAGLAHIPDGAVSPAVLREVKHIEKGLRQLQRQGTYKAFAEKAHDVVSLGGAPGAARAQRRLFEIERPDIGTIMTEVLITGYRDHFVKVRWSCPAERRAEATKTVVPLLRALGQRLAR